MKNLFLPNTNIEEDTNDYIVIKEDGKLLKLLLHEIYYIEAMRDYVKNFIATRSIVTYLTMKKPEETLPAQYFTRIHKSYIIQNAIIKSLQGNMLELKSSVCLPVGLQFRERVLQIIKDRLIKR